MTIDRANAETARPVKVGPMTYTVMNVEDLRQGDQSLDGCCKNSTCEIFLDAGLCDQAARVTLWHEIMHVILMQAGLCEVMTEQLCEVMAHGVMDVLEDNPWLGERPPRGA